jgi:hypothetical protein
MLYTAHVTSVVTIIVTCYTSFLKMSGVMTFAHHNARAGGNETLPLDFDFRFLSIRTLVVCVHLRSVIVVVEISFDSALTYNGSIGFYGYVSKDPSGSR